MSLSNFGRYLDQKFSRLAKVGFKLILKLLPFERLGLVGKLQVLIDNPERTCLIKFQLEIKEGKTNSATLFKLSSSKESQGSFSLPLEIIVHVAKTSRCILHPVITEIQMAMNIYTLETNFLLSAYLVSSGHQSVWRFPFLFFWSSSLHPPNFKRQETASRARYEVPTFGFRRNSIPRL